jgi:hypothetical protein
MSPNPYAERRPGGVTFVIALTWIVAFLSIVSGFLTLMGQDSPVAGTAVDAGQPTWYGAVEIGFGVITGLVALGLAKGSGLARLLVTALMALRVGSAIWVAIEHSGQGGWLVAPLIGGPAVIVLLLLWNGRSDRFFSGF